MGILNSGESFTVNTLIPVGQNPTLRLTFRDAKGKIYLVSR